MNRVLSRVILAAGLLLSACARMPATPRVLTLWHALSGNQMRALNQMIDRYNRENLDGVTLVAEARETASMHQTILQNAKNGALPILMIANAGQLAVYQNLEVVAPLDEWVYSNDSTVGFDAQERASLYPIVFRAGKSADGKLMAMPLGGEAHVLIVNRDVLRAAGVNPDSAFLDWDRLSQMCARVSDITRGSYCFGIESSSAFFEDWIFAHGGRLISDDAKQTTINTPSAIAAMTRLAEFFQSNRAYRYVDARQKLDDLVSRRAAFIFVSTNEAAMLADAIKKRGERIELGVATLPFTISADGRQPGTSYNANYLMMLRGGNTPAAQLIAWKFIKWMAATNQQVEWSSLTNEPVLRADFAVQSVKPDAWNLSMQKAALTNAQSNALAPGVACIRDSAAIGLSQILEGKSITETLRMVDVTARQELLTDCSLR